MEEPRSNNSATYLDRIWPQKWRDVYILILLFVLAVALRGWVLSMTEVPARDSIGFIRYALLFEKEDWKEVIKKSDQHPGYPLWVLLVSWPIRSITGTTDCYTMQYSAQLASSLAGLLLVFPMFYLGKTLFNRAVGFWAALLFQCLPSSGQTLSDAVSDPLFLFLAATALLMGILAVRRRSVWQFTACGALSGLSYLVRPEGALILAAAGMVVLACQLIPAWRRPWRNAIASGVALTLSAVIVGSPYYLVTGKISNKPTVGKLMEELNPKTETQPLSDAGVSGAPLFGSIFAARFTTEGSLSMRAFRGVRAVCTEFAQAYLYLGWIPLLLGLFWYRNRYSDRPEVWVALFYFVFQGAVVLWLVINVGYVSDRHILPLVIASISQVTAATLELPFRLQRRFWGQKAQETNGDNDPARVFLGMRAWSLLLVILMVGGGLTRTLRPLHGHRAGHHAAGVWLGKHTKPADWIIDDHCWAHYYANRVFAENKEQHNPPGCPPCRFIVYSRPKDKHADKDHRRYDEEQIKKMGGIAVYHWPIDVEAAKAQVVIYRIGKRD